MATHDSVLVRLDEAVDAPVQPVPHDSHRIVVDGDEVFMHPGLAEPVPAAQEVRVVHSVEHVEHEVRRPVERIVASVTLLLPPVVDHRDQAGDFRLFGGQLHLGQDAHIPARRKQAPAIDAQREVRQER